MQNLGIKNLGAAQVLGIRVGLQGSSRVQGLASRFGIQDPRMQGLDGGAGSEVHSRSRVQGPGEVQDPGGEQNGCRV